MHPGCRKMCTSGFLWWPLGFVTCSFAEMFPLLPYLERKGQLTHQHTATWEQAVRTPVEHSALEQHRRSDGHSVTRAGVMQVFEGR